MHLKKPVKSRPAAICCSGQRRSGGCIIDMVGVPDHGDRVLRGGHDIAEKENEEGYFFPAPFFIVLNVSRNVAPHENADTMSLIGSA